MAGLVLAHALRILPIGSHGWEILGGLTLVGFAAIWWASKRFYGPFSADARQLVEQQLSVPFSRAS